MAAIGREAQLEIATQGRDAEVVSQQIYRPRSQHLGLGHSRRDDELT